MDPERAPRDRQESAEAEPEDGLMDLVLTKVTRDLRDALEADEEIEAVLVIQKNADEVDVVSRSLEDVGLEVTDSRPYSRNVKVKGSSKAVKKGLADERIRSGMLQGTRVRVRRGVPEKKG